MTISTDSSAPLIVVVGATGTQGGSVINSLAESDRPYRIRGFTRDINKPQSQTLLKKGVQMVLLNPTSDNKDVVFNAFEGATYVFAMTVPNPATEGQDLALGKLYVDASKAANVKLLIWSGLPSITQISNNKYSCFVFDEKASVTEYAKTTGIPFVVVQASDFMQNYLTRRRPIKQPDGSFVLTGPVDPSVPYPVIDTANDYGLFVRKAIEEEVASGTELYAWAELVSHNDLIRTLSQVTGKQVTYVHLSEEHYKAAFVSVGAPRIFVNAMYDACASTVEFGYWGKVDIKPSQQGLARKLTTWKEFCEKSDWSEVLA